MFMRWKADPRPQSLTVYLFQWDRNCFGLLAFDINKALKLPRKEDIVCIQFPFTFFHVVFATNVRS